MLELIIAAGFFFPFLSMYVLGNFGSRELRAWRTPGEIHISSLDRLSLARPHCVIIICPKHNDSVIVFFWFLTHSIAIRTLVTKAMKTFNDIAVGDTFINNDIITAGNSITIIIVADIVMAMIVLVWPVVCVMDEKLTPARLPTTDTHIHPATRS